MRTGTGLYLYKRKNGRYYIGRRVEGRVVWRSTGETTRSAALTRLRQFSEQAIERGDRASLGEFSARFLSIASQHLSPKTTYIYRRALGILKEIAGDCSLSQLTGEHWDRYRSQQMRNLAPASVNLELRALRACFNTAVAWNSLALNPFARRKFVPMVENPPFYFTPNDITKLKGVVTDPLYWDIFLFALLSGCRRGEILALRWSDFDSERGTITIHSSEGFRTKSGKYRVIPVHSLLREMLERRRSSMQCDFIFADRGCRLKGNNVTKRLRNYIREAGLRRELHFHSLRHSFASWLIQSGESLYVVQKLLGHTSPRMTQVYSHLEPTNLERSVERIVL